MTIDERIEALAMNRGLGMREIEALRIRLQTLYAIAQQDGENIRGLARIAEIHERRITSLEGGEQ
jgi:hypothetical protein